MLLSPANNSPLPWAGLTGALLAWPAAVTRHDQIWAQHCDPGQRRHTLVTHWPHGDKSPDTFPLPHCWAGPGPGYKDGVPALWGHFHGDSPRILS